jgi:hypothetical protein
METGRAQEGGAVPVSRWCSVDRQGQSAQGHVQFNRALQQARIHPGDHENMAATCMGWR